MSCGIAKEAEVFSLNFYINTAWLLLYHQLGTDVNPQDLAQPPQGKGSVPSKSALTSDTSHELWGPQATCTAEQLATNSEVSYEPFRLNNSLE